MSPAGSWVTGLPRTRSGSSWGSSSNETVNRHKQGNDIGLAWNDQAEARLDEQEHHKKGAEDSRVEASPAIQQQSGERHGRIVEDEHVTSREGSRDQLQPLLLY